MRWGECEIANFVCQGKKIKTQFEILGIENPAERIAIERTNWKWDSFLSSRDVESSGVIKNDIEVPYREA